MHCYLTWRGKGSASRWVVSWLWSLGWDFLTENSFPLMSVKELCQTVPQFRCFLHNLQAACFSNEPIDLFSRYSQLECGRLWHIAFRILVPLDQGNGRFQQVSAVSSGKGWWPSSSSGLEQQGERCCTNGLPMCKHQHSKAGTESWGGKTWQWIKEFCPQNSLFAPNQLSTLFFSMKIAESGKIVLVSCVIDFHDIQVWLRLSSLNLNSCGLKISIRPS